MKEYPSIERGYIAKGVPIYAFDKIDGSQIRAEWSRKRKFSKFGTRGQLIGLEDKEFGEGARLVLSKYERDLHDIFTKERYERVMCFFEFWGKNSFAGRHQNEEHDVALFDIGPHKKGILPPREFLRLTEGLDRVKLLYHGNANEPFIEMVKSRTLEGMTFEGVVCKAQEMKTYGIPIMFKIKSNDWIEKLKNYCKGDNLLFDKLL